MVGGELRQQHPHDLLSGGDVPAPSNKSLGCCCHKSRPTMINPLTHIHAGYFTGIAAISKIVQGWGVGVGVLKLHLLTSLEGKFSIV